jgi:type VI secretion system protein ImpH
MLEPGWRGDRSLEQWLLDEPHTFDFLQAVHLLELWQGRVATVGQSAPAPLRFRAAFDLSFPSSQIRELRQPSADAPPEMTVNFCGVGGIDGPLPTSFSEDILARLNRQDMAVAEFLDIFHHRLIWLLYNIHKTSLSALATTTPARTPSGRYLFSLMGLGLESLTSQLDAPATLLPYVGLLAEHERSAEGLRALVADYFGVSVEVQQFVGEWCDIEPDQLTYLGTPGKNNELGLTTLVGTRVWIQDAGIGLRIGPLTKPQFADFLPGGRAHAALEECTRFYAGPNLRVFVELVLREHEEANARLGTSRVGWSAWLRTTPADAPDSQVRLRLEPAPGGRPEVP